MPRFPLTIGLWTLVLAISGCASIVTPANEVISFSVEPPASIQSMTIPTLGGLEYKLPCQIPLSRELEYIVQLEDGRSFMINGRFNWWYVGNLLFGGIIGLIIDPITGAISANLEPDRILFKADGTVVNADNDVLIAPSLADWPAWQERIRRKEQEKEARKARERQRARKSLSGPH
jgi:hypothetical protein